MGDVLNYLEDNMQATITFYEGKAIAVELPTTIIREIAYTEPVVRGNTSGNVMKTAKLHTGYELVSLL